jgi:hypothetical protein
MPAALAARRHRQRKDQFLLSRSCPTAGGLSTAVCYWMPLTRHSDKPSLHDDRQHARLPGEGRRANGSSCGRQSCSSGPTASQATGGARRDRTDDLLLAKQALSQLSYGPLQAMVGPGRLELPTSRLSGVRSNHLSYGPATLSTSGVPDGGVLFKSFERRVREERETKTAGPRQMARRPMILERIR